MAEDDSISCPTSCRFVCEDIPNCIPELCTTVTLIFVITFGLLAIPIFIRLVQFHLSSPVPRWSLKKLLYISLFLTCLFRSIGYTLQLTTSDSDTISVVFFLLFFWFGQYFLFMAYSLLLAFWWHMCQKKMTFSWLGRKMKLILLITNTILGLLVAVMIGLYFAPDQTSSALIPNSITAIITVTLCGAYLREGAKFYRMLKTFTQVIPLMEKLTVLLISSSILLIVVIFLLIIFTLVQVAFFPDSNVACQISQVIYRSLEFSVVVVLGYPLRTYGEQDSGETSPPNGKPSDQIIEPEDKSKTKSNQSEESSLKSDT